MRQKKDSGRGFFTLKSAVLLFIAVLCVISAATANDPVAGAATAPRDAATLARSVDEVPAAPQPPAGLPDIAPQRPA